jgi:uncharacterized Tic20 family protein
MRVERTSEEKTLGGLTHLAIFFGWLGLIANVVLYVIYRPKSQFVGGHVKQALGLQTLLLVIHAVLALLFGAGVVGGIGLGSTMGLGAAVGAAFLGGLIGLVVAVGAIILAIIAAIKGFQGQEHNHPIVGNWIAGLGS